MNRYEITHPSELKKTALCKIRYYSGIRYQRKSFTFAATYRCDGCFSEDHTPQKTTFLVNDNTPPRLTSVAHLGGFSFLGG